MAVRDEMWSARRWLATARIEEAQRIVEALEVEQVIGVLGEGAVGKTATIRQALANLHTVASVVELDLLGAASAQHLAFRLARRIASAYIGTREFWTFKEENLVPLSIESQRVKLAELLGVEGLDEALRDWPSGDYELDQALGALEVLANRRTTVLWIDHLEATGLTPRHPLDLERLLWAVREMTQRLPDLSIVLSGRNAIAGRVLGPDAAFHQQGLWLRLGNPPNEAWERVAASFGLPTTAAAELFARTGGHPETMLVGLVELSVGEWGDWNVDRLLRFLASSSGPQTARALQHACSLHRLGGQVLEQIASGRGPYAAAQRGGSSPQEIRKVLGRLQQAGLIRHDEGDGWSLVDPLVEMALRDDLLRPPTADWAVEGEGDSEH